MNALQVNFSPPSWPDHVRQIFQSNLQLLFIGGVTEGYSMRWESAAGISSINYIWSAEKDTQVFRFVHTEMK